jgi:fumarate reductase flavoprotein subunit
MQYSSRLPIPLEEVPDKILNSRKYLQMKAESGWVKITDNWDEIAAWIGCNADALKETVARYNSFCDKGYDEDFTKDKQNLVALRQPPYYAIQVRPLMIESIGPLVINERMEVLDKEDKPIPGFYAAGVITGGWESYDYGGTGGGIAGRNATRYVKGNK